MTKLQKFLLIAALAATTDIFASSNDELSFSNDRETQSAFITAAQNGDESLLQRIAIQFPTVVKPKVTNVIRIVSSNHSLMSKLRHFEETGKWPAEAVEEEIISYSPPLSQEHEEHKSEIENDVRAPIPAFTDTLSSGSMAGFTPSIHDQNFANAGYAGNIEALKSLLSHGIDPIVIENVHFNAMINGDDATMAFLASSIRELDEIYDKVARRNHAFLYAAQVSNVAEAKRVIQIDFRGTNPPPNVISEALTSANIYETSPDMIGFLTNLSDKSQKDIEIALSLGISTSAAAASTEVDSEFQDEVDHAFLSSLEGDFLNMISILKGEAFGAKPSHAVVMSIIEALKAAGDPESEAQRITIEHNYQ